MNFVRYPNFKNDILLIAVGIVGALGALSLIYTNINFENQKFQKNDNSDISYKKSQILAMVGVKDYLTQEEKDAIVKELIGEKIKKFDFSQEEVSKILSVLNKN